MRWLPLFVAVLAATPAAAQQYPPQVVGADLASEVSVKLVTDETVIRPPRRPNEPLYICQAGFRTSRSVPRPFAGQLRVVLFSGESQTVAAGVAAGVRAELTCAVDAAAPRAGVRLVIADKAARKVLYSSVSTFWLPPAPR